MILKGQNFRIMTLVSNKFKCIGMATNCTVNLTTNTDDASHKDVVGMAALPTVISQGWNVQVDSLDVTDTAAMLTAIKSLTPFTLLWDETSTTDNQTGERYHEYHQDDKGHRAQNIDDNAKRAHQPAGQGHNTALIAYHE
jgi:hypothetical protein